MDMNPQQPTQLPTPRTEAARRRALLQYQVLYPTNKLRPVNDVDMAEIERELQEAKRSIDANAETAEYFNNILKAKEQQLSSAKDLFKSLEATHGTLLVALDYNRKERDDLKDALINAGAALKSALMAMRNLMSFAHSHNTISAEGRLAINVVKVTLDQPLLKNLIIDLPAQSETKIENNT